MQIRWNKSDGQGRPDALTVVRDDGTGDYARLNPFFPLHDLLHFAVETTLDYRAAFWGLIASGWSLGDFGVRDPDTGKVRQPPDEANVAENLVGLLQLVETGSIADAEAVIVLLEEHCRDHHLAMPSPISVTQIEAVRTRFAELRGQWLALPPGGTMELSFPEPFL